MRPLAPLAPLRALASVALFFLVVRTALAKVTPIAVGGRGTLPPPVASSAATAGAARRPLGPFRPHGARVGFRRVASLRGPVLAAGAGVGILDEVVADVLALPDLGPGSASAADGALCPIGPVRPDGAGARVAAPVRKHQT